MRRIFLPAAVMVIATLAIARFLDLGRIPPGVFPDEATNAMHMLCLAQTGRDGNGVAWPFYSRQFEPSLQKRARPGLMAPTLSYPGAAWVAAFGPSPASLRALSAVLVALGITALCLLVGRLLGPRAALFAALSALASPWIFQLGHICLVTAPAFCFECFGMLFFLRSNRRRHAVASGLCLAAALASYAAFYVQIPLLFLALVWLKRRLGALDRRFVAWAAGALALAALPVAAFVLFSSESLVRASYVSIFSPEHLGRLGGWAPLTALGEFLTNVLLHFSPTFLLISGDANPRHSTQLVGELSGLDAFAIAAAAVLWLWSRRRAAGAPPGARARAARSLAWFALLGYLGGVIPAATTWEKVPHALRAAGAAPFIPIATAALLWTARRLAPRLQLVAVVVTIAFSAFFLQDWFVEYGPRSSVHWDGPLMALFEQAKADGNWAGLGRYLAPDASELALRYYLVAVDGKDCQSSKTRIDGLARLWGRDFGAQ